MKKDNLPAVRKSSLPALQDTPKPLLERLGELFAFFRSERKHERALWAKYPSPDLKKGLTLDDNGKIVLPTPPNSGKVKADELPAPVDVPRLGKPDR